MRKPASFLLYVVIIACIAGQIFCVDFHGPHEQMAGTKYSNKTATKPSDSTENPTPTTTDRYESPASPTSTKTSSDTLLDTPVQNASAVLQQQLLELNNKAVADAAQAQRERREQLQMQEQEYKSKTASVAEQHLQLTKEKDAAMQILKEELNQLYREFESSKLDVNEQEKTIRDMNALKETDRLAKENAQKQQQEMDESREQKHALELRLAAQRANNAQKQQQEMDELREQKHALELRLATQRANRTIVNMTEENDKNAQELREENEKLKQRLESMENVPWYGDWTGYLDWVGNMFVFKARSTEESKPAPSDWIQFSYPVHQGVTLLQQIKELADILFLDVRKDNGKVFQVDSQIWGGALYFGILYVTVLLFSQWMLRTKHSTIQITRDSNNIVGGYTSVSGNRDLFRPMEVVVSVDIVAGLMGYGLMAQIHPLFSVPCLALYFNATREKKAATWMGYITGFFKADNMFRCISILIQAMLTLDATKIATASIVTAYYGVPRLFNKEGDVHTSVEIIGETCYEVITQLYTAIQHAGPNKIFTFANKDAITTLFQISFVIDILMIWDMNTSQRKPNVTWMTGTTMKMKALCPMYFLWACGSFRIIHRMTPASVFWNTVSTILNLSWHTLANPIMRFLFDVLQALTPVITWTGLLGSYHYNFFPKSIQINHSVAAWRGESILTAEAASEEDGIFRMVVAAMVFMWIFMLNCLDDKHKIVKKSVFCNLGSALCSPYRLHVEASTLVWVTVKCIIFLGRPFGLFSSNMVTHNTLEWPQTVMCILFYDTLLNSMWACQVIAGNLAPQLVGHCSFKYYTHVVIGPGLLKTGTQPEEFYLIEEKVETSYLSLWRGEEVDKNSLSCTGIELKQNEDKVLLTELFAEFVSPTCKEASVYTKEGVYNFRVGRAHADHKDNETRKDNEVRKSQEKHLAAFKNSNAPRPSRLAAPDPPAGTDSRSEKKNTPRHTQTGASRSTRPASSQTRFSSAVDPPEITEEVPLFYSRSHGMMTINAHKSPSPSQAKKSPLPSHAHPSSTSAPQTPATSPNTFFGCVLGAVLNYLRSVQDSTSVGTQ